jgi:hypothetical protein
MSLPAERGKGKSQQKQFSRNKLLAPAVWVANPCHAGNSHCHVTHRVAPVGITRAAAHGAHLHRVGWAEALKLKIKPSSVTAIWSKFFMVCSPCGLRYGTKRRELNAPRLRAPRSALPKSNAKPRPMGACLGTVLGGGKENSRFCSQPVAKSYANWILSLVTFVLKLPD